jgi:hypothetical protein
MPPLPFPWSHHRWSAQASAFVDDELDAAGRTRYERHLAGCARCTADVESLRSTKLLIASMPPVPAPRSFRLTPQMVVAPVAAPRRAPVAALRTAQFAAGLAVIAFIAVLTIDLTSSHSSHTTSGQLETMAASAANTAPKSAQDAAGGSSTGATGPDVGAATPAPTPTAGIVPPSGGGVGGAGAPCGLPQPLTPAGGAGVPVDPSTCPSPSPTPVEHDNPSATAVPQAPATGSNDSRDSATAQTFGANNSIGGPATPEAAHADAAVSESSSWERPTEWSLAIVAALAIAASAFLMVRRRRG